MQWHWYDLLISAPKLPAKGPKKSTPAFIMGTACGLHHEVAAVNAEVPIVCCCIIVVGERLLVGRRLVCRHAVQHGARTGHIRVVQDRHRVQREVVAVLRPRQPWKAQSRIWCIYVFMLCRLSPTCATYTVVSYLFTHWYKTFKKCKITVTT